MSGWAAAHLLGLPGATPVPPEVTAGLGSTHRVPGVRVRRSGVLPNSHITECEGILVTTVSRTLIDVARCGSVVRVGSMLDQLVRTKRVTVEQVVDDFDELARRGRPGIATMRAVLEPRLGGSVVERSELERRGLGFLRRNGFDLTDVEFRPPWAGPQVARVDVADPRRRVVIEFDGRRWHDNDEAFERDRVRDQLAMAAGWIVVRITWHQLERESAATARRLRAILDSRPVLS